MKYFLLGSGVSIFLQLLGLEPFSLKYCVASLLLIIYHFACGEKK